MITVHAPHPHPRPALRSPRTSVTSAHPRFDAVVRFLVIMVISAAITLVLGTMLLGVG